MIVTVVKTHKRKRSQQERNEKLAKKLATMRTKRARKQLQAEKKTDVEPTEAHVARPPDRTLGVQRRIVDDLEQDWNANDANEVKREKHAPDAWNMKIADVRVGDFVVLEATRRGISVAQVGFFFPLSLIGSIMNALVGH